MRPFTWEIPTLLEFLALTPRQLAGLLLELVNQDATVSRYHPKNLRSDLLRDYPNAPSKAVEQLVNALGILADGQYVARDYSDAVDNEWFVLTERGRAVHDRHALDLPEARLASQKSLIFVSCGQYLENEKALGARIVRIIEDRTPHSAFFAENQRSFEGLSKNIIEALHRMVGMVFVMHKRGLVTLGSFKFQRGSVWIEQEIAIAASLQQLGHKIAVAGYIEDGIKREGLRDLLHLNPMSFVSDDDVAADLEKRIANGNFSPTTSAPPTPAVPMPLLNVDARMMWPDEQRALALPVTNSMGLVLSMTNAGLGPASDIIVRFEGLMYPADEEHIVAIGSGATSVRAFRMPHYSAATANAGEVPETISILYSGIGWRDGCLAITRVPGSQPPTWVIKESRKPSPA